MNRSLNNMRGDLFALLQATGYTIETAHDDEEEVQPSDLGCEGTNLDTEEPEVVTLEQEKHIEDEINVLSYDEQLECNLRQWYKYTPSLNDKEKLKKQYLRYRVDFPHETATVGTCKLIEANRGVLFNLACSYKLVNQSGLHNYLLRENHSGPLENIYKQLTAMKVLFGALTGTKDKAVVAQMTPPERLEGRVIEENIEQILGEINKTGLPRLIGIRVRNKRQAPSVKWVMGFVNQATKCLFGFTYQPSGRIQIERQRYCSWELTPRQLIGSLSIVDVARRSTLCANTQAPGHPLVPLPGE
jgi:hypothetical protein